MKLLLTGAFNYTETQFRDLENLGFDITFIQEERKEVSFDVSEFEVVVCNNLFLYNDISKFNNLKAVQLTSAGFDRVPLNYIKENMNVDINMYQGEILGVNLPNTVELEVTETEPGIRGDTVSGGSKAATLETR